MKNHPPLSSMPRDDAEPNPTKSGWFAPRSPTSFGGPIARKSNPHPRPRLEPQHRWRRGPCPHLDVRSPGRLSGPARLQLPHLSHQAAENLYWSSAWKEWDAVERHHLSLDLARATSHAPSSTPPHGLV